MRKEPTVILRNRDGDVIQYQGIYLAAIYLAGLYDIPLKYVTECLYKRPNHYKDFRLSYINN